MRSRRGSSSRSRASDEPDRRPWAQAAALLDAAREGRMHHAWLLSGRAGIGKASFAEAAARRLLAEAAGAPLPGEGLDVSADHPTARLMAAGSHPDYRRLERRRKDAKSDELARSIPIDEIRALLPMFATMPSMSARRVVVIDAIDDLERPAANALLKSLEEPPAGTIFLLVSHAPGRLLPTIRSRCRLLRFSPLPEAETRAVLARTLDADEAAALARLAGGAPGGAVRFAGLDVAGLDATIERLVAGGDPANVERGGLARALSAKAQQPRYELFLERASARLAAEAKRRRGPALAAALELWEQARRIADGAVRLSLDPQATVFELAGLLAALAPGDRIQRR